MRWQQNLLLQTWETRGQSERRTSQPSDAAGRANGWRKVQHHPTDTPWGSERETAALLSHAGSAHGSTQAGELQVSWYSLFRLCVTGAEPEGMKTDNISISRAEGTTQKRP